MYGREELKYQWLGTGGYQTEIKAYSTYEADQVMDAMEARIKDLEDKNRHLGIIAMFDGDILKMAERIRSLEAKLENVQASMYAENVDANMSLIKANDRIKELEDSEYKWFALVRDFVTVLGNDPYMVYVAIESRLKSMCDNDEIDRWHKLNQSILDRLKVMTPHDWHREKENAR